MTEWQWQVILALIRAVLEKNNHTFGFQQDIDDRKLLNEALERDKNYQEEKK